MTLSTHGRWICVCVAATAAIACGKKGPPLAPFARVPAAVTTVTPQRIGDDIYLSFTVPETNVDGQKPAFIAEVNVYAVTSDVVPTTEEQRELATLVATLPVRTILPPLPVPANGSAPPPLPVMPGVDRGAVVAVRETLSAETRVPVELPIEKPRNEPAPVDADAGEFVGALVAPPPSRLPRRHYFVMSVSPRGRESAPSTPVSVPLEGGSSAPGAPTVTHDTAQLVVTWPPSPDARTSSFLLPPTEKPVVAANATPAAVTPKVPAALPVLAAKSLGFTSEATRYHVYDVSPAGSIAAIGATPPAAPQPEAVEENPFALKLPVPLTPAPLEVTEFTIKGIAFDVERCFEVRPVDQVFGTVVIGPASPRACITPKDTFPPAAPTSLAAIAAPGVISLIWNANAEPDVAGYIVLRGEAPGGTLQALNTEPLTATTYRDETVKPGVRYVYAVVAVDRATPQNISPQSNRVEETARQ